MVSLKQEYGKIINDLRLKKEKSGHKNRPKGGGMGVENDEENEDGGIGIDDGSHNDDNGGEDARDSGENTRTPSKIYMNRNDHKKRS